MREKRTYKKQEFVSPSQEQKENEKGSLRDWFDGKILVRDNVVRQLPLFVFIVILSMVYIGGKYRYENKFREYRELKKEVTLLKNKSLLLGTELMKMNRQTQVLKKLEERKMELRPSSDLPVRIKVKK